jgi:hypothetical protein
MRGIELAVGLALFALPGSVACSKGSGGAAAPGPYSDARADGDVDGASGSCAAQTCRDKCCEPRECDAGLLVCDCTPCLFPCTSPQAAGCCDASFCAASEPVCYTTDFNGTRVDSCHAPPADCGTGDADAGIDCACVIGWLPHIPGEVCMCPPNRPQAVFCLGGPPWPDVDAATD